MQLQYAVDVDDLIQFNIYHSDHSPAVTRLLWRSAILGTILGIVLLLALGYSASTLVAASSRHVVWAITVLAAVFFPILYLPKVRPNYRKRLRHTLKKLYSEEGNSDLGPRVLDVQDTGVLVISPQGESRTSWQSITKLSETPEYAFVYLGPAKAHIIPKRSIRSGDLSAVVAEMRQRIQASPSGAHAVG
jgi:hypothetical protein